MKAIAETVQRLADTEPKPTGAAREAVELGIEQADLADLADLADRGSLKPWAGTPHDS
ncbi:MAG: hypothetical protein WBN10_19390 [Polyangiales bacterium]